MMRSDLAIRKRCSLDMHRLIDEMFGGRVRQHYAVILQIAWRTSCFRA
jgi:hypothetical protein